MGNQKIADFIFNAADCKALQPAIYISDEKYVTYSKLSSLITSFSKKMEKIGICEKSRIAMILPNTAESIIAFYAITLNSIAIPLHSNYSQSELKRCLIATNAQAIVTTDINSDSLTLLADELKLPLLTLQLCDDDIILKQCNRQQLLPYNTITSEENLAAIFLTSGTTDASKVVALSHTNLIVPAEAYKEAFQVKSSDIAANLIPLSHIYGVTGSVLVAAAAGCSIICIPQFNAPDFFEIAQKVQINWYAAGPTIHSAIAEHAKRINARPEEYSIKVIRSGGAPISTETANTLKKHFHAIVLPGYGLTETGGLATTNLLPPHKNKIQSSGVPLGVELKIMSEDNHQLYANEIGQVFVKGPSVISGYENSDNTTSFFHDGWFATGDLGYLDEDGYLFLVGRIKELINKGGVKISPYEIEAVLLSHPNVSDAVVFPAPHPTLGEIPMAVVVTDDSIKLTDTDLKLFLHKHLSIGNIPAEFFFTKQIPTNKIGKVMRSTLYEYIQKNSADFITNKEIEMNVPTDPKFLEVLNSLTSIWKEILKIETLKRDDNFFALGGDSLGVIFMFSRIEEIFGIELPPELILTNGTVYELAVLIFNTNKQKTEIEFIVPLQLANNSNTSLFCIHALNGDALTYRRFTECIGDDISVYGVIFKPHSPKLEHPVLLPALAALYVKEIQSIQPKGPYNIMGYSLGGVIAYEIAKQLREQGEEIGLLALLDTRFEFTEKLIAQTFANLRNKMLEEIKVFHKSSNQLKNEYEIANMLKSAFLKYQLKPYEGTLIYYFAELADPEFSQKTLTLLKNYVNEIEVVHIKSLHAMLIFEPAMDVIAKHIQNHLNNQNMQKNLGKI